MSDPAGGDPGGSPLPASTTAAPAWGRSRGSPLGWRIVLWTVRTLGRHAAYRLVSVIVAWFSIFARAPGLARYRSLSPGVTVGAVYRQFGMALVDRMAFLLEGPAQFTYTYEGVEHLYGVYGAEGGALLLSAHLGNVEVAATGRAAAGRFRKLRAVRFSAEGDHGNDLFAGLPEAWRPDLIHIRPGEGFAALEIVRELRAGALVALHGDRVVDDRVTRVQLLGAEADLPAGPWLVAALARVPVVVVGCFRTGRDSYHLVACPPVTVRFDRGRARDAQVQDWVQAYADVLSGWARRWPDQWYNFHDLWAATPPPGSPSSPPSPRRT